MKLKEALFLSFIILISLFSSTASAKHNEADHISVPFLAGVYESNTLKAFFRARPVAKIDVTLCSGVHLRMTAYRSEVYTFKARHRVGIKLERRIRAGAGNDALLIGTCLMHIQKKVFFDRLWREVRKESV